MPEGGGSPRRANSASGTGARIDILEGVGVTAAQRNYYAFILTPDNWDFLPGDSFTLRILYTRVLTNAGQEPTMAPANVMRVRFHLPGGAQVGSTISVGAGSTVGWTDVTVHLDSDPGNQALGAALRSGMLEIVLEVERNVAVAWGPIDSRGGGAGTPPAPAHTVNWWRAYFRSRVVLSDLRISNVSLGGAEPAKFRVADNMFLRSTMSADWYRSGTFGYSLRQGATECRSSTVSSATGAVRDDTYNTTATTVGGKGRVNTGLWAKALTATKARLTLPATSFGGDAEYAWADSGHRTGFTRVDDATLDYDAEIDVDPRITFSQLLQHNDSAWGTPPSSKNVANGRRLTTDLSFLAARAVNADGEGLANGLIAWSEKLWDSNQLIGSEASPVKQDASVTVSTQGGETGWSDAFLVWDNALPGGNWIQKETILTAEFAGCEVNNTRTLALLAFDSEIIREMLEGDLTGPLDHWYPGKPLAIGVAAMKKGVKQTIDSARIWLTRPKIGPLGDVTTESLQSNRTSWATGDPGDTHAHVLSASADDAKVFRINFTAAETNAWASYYDVAIGGEIVIAGTPYPVGATLSVTGSKSRHGQEYDLYVGAGPTLDPGLHAIVGVDVTIGIGLRGASGVTAMDASSAQWAATRFHPVDGVLQFWNNTTGAWVTTGTPIYNAATIGAVGTEPLLAWATLPAAALDLTGDIRILAKATKTRAGTVVAEPFEASFNLPVVGSKWKHTQNEPEASVTWHPTAGHAHLGAVSDGGDDSVAVERP